MRASPQCFGLFRLVSGRRTSVTPLAVVLLGLSTAGCGSPEAGLVPAGAAEPMGIGVDAGAATVGLIEDAQASALAGDLDEAVLRYRDVIEHDPDSVVARIGLARVELAAGNRSRALPLLERAQLLSEAGGDQDPDLRWLLGCARLASADDEVVLAGELLLRDELANGDRGVAAALELATHFASLERYPEAIAVADAGRRRFPLDADLVYLQARLAADTADFDRAASLLQALIIGKSGVVDVAPARFALAEVEAARGRLERARELLAQLGAAEAASDPWVQAHRNRVEGLRNELSTLEEGGRLLSGQQFLAVMRNPRASTGERSEALKVLLNVADPVARRRAVMVAVLQPSDTLRALAIKRWPADDPDLALVVASALVQDPSGVVRARAGERLGALEERDRSWRVQQLIDALAVERDPYAFRSLHNTLATLHGGRAPFLAPGAEERPLARAEVARAWRMNWQSW